MRWRHLLSPDSASHPIVWSWVALILKKWSWVNDTALGLDGVKVWRKYMYKHSMIIILKRSLRSMFNSCCKESWYVSSRGHECGEPNSCLIAMCPPLPVWWFPQDTIRPPSYTQEIPLIASTIFVYITENDWLRTIKWNWPSKNTLTFSLKE